MLEEVKSKEPAIDSQQPAETQAAAVAPAKKEDIATLYDASANIKFPYTVTDNGQKYDVAHIFAPLTDERYMQWNRDLKVSGTAENIEENSREATCKLWDDLIVGIEGAEYDQNADWRSFVDAGEKVQAINDLLAVAIVDDDTPAAANGKLKLGAPSETQTIFTEAYFNGEVLRQCHVLTRSTFELQKRYERIKAKTIRQENVRGLRRAQKIEYVPQDEKFGELYDEMCVSLAGFIAIAPGSDKIPLRFKAAVINYIFAPKLDQKLVGK